MSDFSVEFIGDTPEDMQKRLTALSHAVDEGTDEALLEAAEDVKEDIEDTAPVDTGDYQGSWYIQEIDEDEVWVLSDSNEAPHNKYLMLPNSNFVGSGGADVPSLGIYHNVEGIAKQHQSSLRLSLSNMLDNLFRSFKVK